ncbi:MAG: phosphotransferase [Euryarchaeota archaeon]|nr:phosphotransferase [Euryarchaeota archaeon]
MATREKTLTDYLRSLYGPTVQGVRVSELGRPTPGQIKRFGYGRPYQVEFQVHGRPRRAVLASIVESPFGHETPWDRAGILLWQHHAFNTLPGHARSLDVGFFTPRGEMRSAGEAEEFFQLMEMAPGDTYAKDLERIRATGATPLDQRRVDSMASYLAGIHRRKSRKAILWHRRVRDLVGHGEMILGMGDSYPPGWERRLAGVEKQAVEWRWKLKQYPHRLSWVHGDFHPWNILFTLPPSAGGGESRRSRDQGVKFHLLDRSRGEWGEPGDDVSSITINYILFSVLKHGKLAGDYQRLFERFYQVYLKKSGDREMLDVIQPWYAFRGLVVASPVWYPNHTKRQREALFGFVENVMDVKRFDPKRVNRYLG